MKVKWHLTGYTQLCSIFIHILAVAYVLRKVTLYDFVSGSYSTQLMRCSYSQHSSCQFMCPGAIQYVMDRGLSQLGHTYLIVWFTYTGSENIGSVGHKFKKEENKIKEFLQTLY